MQIKKNVKLEDIDFEDMIKSCSFSNNKIICPSSFYSYFGKFFSMEHNLVLKCKNALSDLGYEIGPWSE